LNGVMRTKFQKEGGKPIKKRVRQSRFVRGGGCGGGGIDGDAILKKGKKKRTRRPPRGDNTDKRVTKWVRMGD